MDVIQIGADRIGEVDEQNIRVRVGIQGWRAASGQAMISVMKGRRVSAGTGALSLVPSGSRASVGGAFVADDPASVLFRDQYVSMVRLACAVLGSRPAGEDAVQDAFAAVAVRLADLPPDAHVRYLRTAVMNACLKVRRGSGAAKRQPVVSRETTASVEDDAIAFDERRRMSEALEALSARQRQCVVLRFYGELTDAEIATALGLSAGSTKTHLRRGIARLRAQMEMTR